MLEFEEARQRVLDACREAVLPFEPTPLVDALGRVLREDLLAPTPLPPFDYSAMDGYCLSSARLSGSAPFELTVAGESRTGHPCPALPEGAALRIFTGARLPEHADAVVIQENTERAGDRVRLLTTPRAGDHVRRRGEDLEAGELALDAGTRLGPFQLGLAAAVDRATLLVSRRPRVVILPSGDELRAPGRPGAPDSIPESNGVVLRALCSLAGAEAELGPRLPDELEPAARAFAAAFERADLVVTVGGMSVGDHDLVRPALERAGATLDFWKVRLQPGKPLAFGRRGSAFVLGLPGNPVSAQITFSLFGMPLLRALCADRAPLPERFAVVLGHDLSRKPGRLGVYRARLFGSEAWLDDNQSSGATTSLARAAALVFVPADTARCPSGTRLEAIRLDDV